MDIASVIGSIIGVAACIIVGYMASHGDWMMFWSPKGVIMVFGGTISVLFMAMPLDKLLCVPGYFKRFFFDSGLKPIQVIELMNKLSEKARRDGILALESEVGSITDPFLRGGLKMAIDGVEPSNIDATLRIEVLAMQDRHKAGKKFFDLIKLYGPGYGLVATLIGQAGMFGSLATADVGTLGHMLAIAVVATMYGTVLANAVAGPIGDKLALRSSEEILGREMMIQGILSIQQGDNPRVTMDKMIAFLPGPAKTPFLKAA